MYTALGTDKISFDHFHIHGSSLDPAQLDIFPCPSFMRVLYTELLSMMGQLQTMGFT